MSFATKKYTRPALRKAISSINVNSFINFNTFANALSPIAGRKSAQVTVLRKTINMPLKAVFAGSTKQNKSLLLALLK